MGAAHCRMHFFQIPQEYFSLLPREAPRRTVYRTQSLPGLPLLPSEVTDHAQALTSLRRAPAARPITV